MHQGQSYELELILDQNKKKKNHSVFLQGLLWADVGHM